jgi:signal peptidase
VTHDVVTLRVDAIQPLDDGEYCISLRGDGYEVSDALDDFVGETVWQPEVLLGGWGTAVQRLTTPLVALPLHLGSAGLLGSTLLVPAPIRAPRARRVTCRRPVATVSC